MVNRMLNDIIKFIDLFICFMKYTAQRINRYVGEIGNLVQIICMVMIAYALISEFNGENLDSTNTINKIVTSIDKSFDQSAALGTHVYITVDPVEVIASLLVAKAREKGYKIIDIDDDVEDKCIKIYRFAPLNKELGGGN